MEDEEAKEKNKDIFYHRLENLMENLEAALERKKTLIEEEKKRPKRPA